MSNSNTITNLTLTIKYHLSIYCSISIIPHCRFDLNASQPEVQLCIARQNAIKRDVIGAIGSVWGAALGGGLSLWSTRKYYGEALLVLK